MKYAILADIHGNLEAFRSVLAHLRGIDKYIDLGDSVGYGPNPNECIELLRSNKFTSVLGNHDKVAIGKFDAFLFNKDAKDAIEWTKKILTPENRKFLESLPEYLDIDGFEIVHGSLRDHIEEYILSLYEAVPSIESMKHKLCLVGHSHIPICIFKNQADNYDGWQLSDGDVIDLSKFKNVIVNVGGVGQPRDGDPRASFGVYDSDEQKVQIHKVSYNIEETQKKMKEAGLPDYLIERLIYGR